MLNRVLIGLLLIAGAMAEAQLSQEASAYNREVIRSMPITSRPMRPGHFYGNTVRRVHHLRGGR